MNGFLPHRRISVTYVRWVTALFTAFISPLVIYTHWGYYAVDLCPFVYTALCRWPMISVHDLFYGLGHLFYCLLPSRVWPVVCTGSHVLASYRHLWLLCVLGHLYCCHVPSSSLVLLSCTVVVVTCAYRCRRHMACAVVSYSRRCHLCCCLKYGSLCCWPQSISSSRCRVGTGSLRLSWVIPVTNCAVGTATVKFVASICSQRGSLPRIRGKTCLTAPSDQKATGSMTID